MATKKSMTNTSYSPNVNKPNVNFGIDYLNKSTKVVDNFTPITKTKDLNANTFESQFGVVQTQDSSGDYTTESNFIAPVNRGSKKPNLSISSSDIGFFGEGGSDWLLDEKSKPLNFFEIPSYKAKSLEAMDEMIKIRNSGKVDDSLKKIVGETKFNDIREFRNRIDLTSQMVLNDMRARGAEGERQVEGFVSGQGNNAAIFSDIPSEYISRGASYLQKVTGIDANVPTFRETEQAKSELESKGLYKKANIARTAGAIQETFTGYSAFGKVVDKTLLASKIPASAGLTGVIGREIQAGLKASYVNNPKTFNFISNSAQEVIEYGVRKSINPDSTSLGQLITGVAAGKVFSEFSSPGKSLKGIASTRDYNALSAHINDIKTKMPDMSDEDIVTHIQDFKMKDMGMSVREVGEMIAKRNKDSDKIIKSTPEVLQNHLAEGGVYISSGGAKKLNETLDYLNDSILRDSKGNKAESFNVSTNLDNGDIVGFKQELILSLKNGNEANTSETIGKLVDELGKKYGVSIGVTGKSLTDMDTLEEALLKPNASMSNISNPKTSDNLLTQFGFTPTTKVDLDEVKTLDAITTELNSKKSRTENQAANLAIKLGKLRTIYEQFSVNPNSKNPVYHLENAIYKVPKGITGKTRLGYIEGVKEQTKLMEDGFDSISRLRSTTKEGDINRIFANTKIAKLLGEDSKNYLTNLKKANSIIEDIKSGKDSVYFTDAKIKEAQYAIERAKILNELPPTGFYEIADGINISLKKGDALINGGFVDRLNTPYRVLGNALGYDSTAFKTLVTNPMSAESNWINHGDKLIGDINGMMIRAGLEDKYKHNKFSMWMMSRRFDGNKGEIDPKESMVRAINLRKDSKGNLVNTSSHSWFERKISSRFKEPSVQLSIEDVNKFIKEGEDLVKNNPELQKLVTYMDKEFASNAEVFNNIMKVDGKIISTTKNYFPIKKYKVGESFETEELQGVNFDTMEIKFLENGFLNDIKRAQSQDSFSLELDLGRVMSSYKDNQLYFIHMKPEVDRMGKIVNTARDSAIKTAKDGSIVDVGGAFGPNIQKYLGNHIDNIKQRGTSNIDATSKQVNRFASGIVSYLNIGFNVFSAAAQPLSLLDNALFHANTLDSIGRAMRADPNEAMAVSGILRQRMTEHISGLAERKGFDITNPLSSIGSMVNNKDIQSIGLYGKSWNQSLLDTSLRAMKRVDGATSTTSWYSAFYDKLDKTFPELKGTETSLSDIKDRIGEVAFYRIRNYADGTMSNVMFQGSSVVNKQQAVAMGTMYSLNTLLMKTMLNRSFLLNDAWRNSSVGKLKQVSLVAMSYALEESRKYSQQQTSIAVGDKDVYSYYDGVLVKTGDWLTGGDMKEENPEARVFLNAFGGFVGNYMGGGSMGFDTSLIFKKATDSWNFYERTKGVPLNRQVIGIGEAVTQNLLPGSMKYAVPIIHKNITGENRFKQRTDDTELSYILKNNPEKLSVVSGMSFAEQANQARMSKEGNVAEKIVSDRNAVAKKKVDDLMKEVYSLYGVPTKDEIYDYAKKNRDRFREAGFKKADDLDSLIESSEEYKIKISTGEESYIPKNIEAIYEFKIKEMAKAGDRKGVNEYIYKLQKDGVIKDLDGTRKKIKSYLKRDELLGY